MIRVDPLPEGTTDVNTLEAGWNFVDQEKIIVYGAIDPHPTIMNNLDSLLGILHGLDIEAFKRPIMKWRLLWKTFIVKSLVEWERDTPVLKIIEKAILPRFDGCTESGTPDSKDWLVDCEVQKQIYWDFHELQVLLNILN